MKGKRLILGQVALLTMLVGVAQAAEIQPTRTIRNVDMATAGIGGIDTGNGSILLSGVNGTVSKAYLYWHGYNSDGDYNRPSIVFKGQAVTGRSLGISSTNCWEAQTKPNGRSAAFEADVTSLVTGNGSYSLAGLAQGASDHANGASLVVLYQDGNTANNRDVVIYTGNDSSSFGAAFGDSEGWHASLPGINYSGGNVFATLHVADGQTNGSDSPVRFSTAGGSVTISDTATLFDGLSVPSGGVQRLGFNLWDIHTFDITGAFGGTTGAKTLAVDSDFAQDCSALINLTLSFAPGDAPDVGGPGDATTCVSEGYTGTKRVWCQNVCENGLTGQPLAAWIHRWIQRYRDLPYCAVQHPGNPPPNT